MIYLFIGNYGINCDDFELMKFCIKGMVVKEVCVIFLNFRSEKIFDEVLKDFGILGIYGIDIRVLIRKFCLKGVVKGCFVLIDRNVDEVVVELKKIVLFIN